MKKKIFIFLALLTITIPSIASAKELEMGASVEQIDQREMLIQNKMNEFLKEKNKADVYSLTEDEEI